MFGRYCMQEVALVFAAVQSLMELHALWALDDPCVVAGGEADPMQGNIELARDCARVLEVLCGCTVTVVVLFPVTHEEPLDCPALLLEEKSRHGGIHSA